MENFAEKILAAFALATLVALYVVSPFCAALSAPFLALIIVTRLVVPLIAGIWRFSRKHRRTTTAISVAAGAVMLAVFSIPPVLSWGKPLCSTIVKRCI